MAKSDYITLRKKDFKEMVDLLENMEQYMDFDFLPIKESNEFILRKDKILRKVLNK